MYYLIFRTLVSTATIALTVSFLPGFTIDNPNLLGFLLVGMLFGVLNTFVRPFLIFLTGRLVIRTMGLFMIVVNGLLLAILTGLLPAWHLDNIFTVLFAGLFVGVVGALMDAILGINRPVLDEIENGERYWKFLSRVDSGRRSAIIENLRFEQVYDTFWRYGLEIGISRTPLAPIRRYIGQLFYPNSQALDEMSVPSQVRIMLQELGPTYVKLGQVVSSQAQSLTPEWAEELAKLQSNVAPFPGREAQAIIADELGAPLTDLYAEVAPEPFAAASTAQVHRAKLLDGTDVVVKVQRPMIVPKVKADLGIITETIQTAEKRFEWARNSDLSGMFHEFATNVIGELDYRNEAYYAVRLKHNMSTIPGITVPTVYPDHSTSKVLTMDFVRGVKITNVDQIDAAGLDRSELASRFLRAMVKQVMVDGFMHGDPHPGNVMVNLETGDITFLDMGMMGTLSRNQRMSLIDLLWAIQAQDGHEMASVFMQLSTTFKPFDEQKYREKVEEVVDRYMVFGDQGGGFAGVVNAALDVLYDSGLRLDRDLTVALKALIQAEEIVTTLDPNIYIINVAFAGVREAMLDQFNVDNVTQVAKTQAVRTAREVIRRLPTLQEATLRWLDQYEKGRFSVTIETDELAKQVQRITVAIQRLAVGLVLLSIILGASFAMNAEGKFLGVPLASIGFVLFIASLSFGSAMVWRLYRASESGD